VRTGAAAWDHLRRRAKGAGALLTGRRSRVRWVWDYPPSGTVLRGRTLLVDGWAADWPSGAPVVVASGERILATTTARLARPDVVAAFGLENPFVGFHLEADISAAASGDWLPVTLRVPTETGAVTETRDFLTGADELPYEESFRRAEARGRALGRAEIYGSGPPSRVVQPDILDVVRRHARDTVLDVGCGVGAYGLALTERRAGTVRGVEYDAAAAGAARRDGLAVIRGDARQLPIRDRAVDTIVAVEVIEHVEGPEQVVAEFARVTRQNVIVTVPNASVIPHLAPCSVVPWHLLEATHVNFFSTGTLEALLRGGFRHVQVGYCVRLGAFPGLPPLYYHLVGLAAHEPAGLEPPGRRPSR
jgi:SAM-dependent methyltransferase